MAERSTWTGTAADLLRAGAPYTADSVWMRQAGWPQNPSVLAGRLRRAQTFLRTLGIEIAFIREGHAGTRVIKICNVGKKSFHRQRRLQRQLNGYRADEDALLAPDGADG